MRRTYLYLHNFPIPICYAAVLILIRTGPDHAMYRGLPFGSLIPGTWNRCNFRGCECISVTLTRSQHRRPGPGSARVDCKWPKARKDSMTNIFCFPIWRYVHCAVHRRNNRLEKNLKNVKNVKRGKNFENVCERLIKKLGQNLPSIQLLVRYFAVLATWQTKINRNHCRGIL